MAEQHAKFRSEAYAQLVQRAWSDASFKTRLLADPQAALVSAGVPLPAGVNVKVVENTDTLIHLVLPPKPQSELSDEVLQKVVAGAACGAGSCSSEMKKPHLI